MLIVITLDLFYAWQAYKVLIIELWFIFCKPLKYSIKSIVIL